MATSGRYDNNIGPILGSAQEGFDRPYQKVRREAQAELGETMAGPAKDVDVPPDDTELKNPGNAFAAPASGPARPHGHGAGHPRDPEGRQGGYPPTDRGHGRI
jgi:hypothetical protein